jgi:hypothetical protein
MIQGPPGGGGSGYDDREDGHEPGDYSRYPQDETPGFNQWEPVEVPAFSAAADQPFELHAIAFRSSSRQSEVFIHDPVRALTGRSQGVDTWRDDGFVGEPLLREAPDRINSVVLRHERTLEHRIVRAMALADDDGSVSLVIHKHEAG